MKCKISLEFAGQLSMMMRLLANGADVNAINAENETALISAIRRNHMNAAKMLIENGIDVNIGRQAGKSPLHFAITQGKQSKSKSPNRQIVFGGSEKYVMFCLGYYELAEIIIDHGGDINFNDDSGVTPMMSASIVGKI